MNNTIQEDLLDLELASPFIQTEISSFSPSVETAVGEKYVIFFLNEEIYAVSAKYVMEVIVPLRLTPLPKTPEWFLGIANLRGNIISVIDLPGFWNTPISSPSLKSKLILLNSKNGDSQIAFAVDKLCEIVVLQDSDNQTREKNSFGFCSEIKYKSKVARLLDAEKLFSSLKN